MRTTLTKLTCLYLPYLSFGDSLLGALSYLGSEETVLNVTIASSQRPLFSQPSIIQFSIFPFVQTEMDSFPRESLGDFRCHFGFKKGSISHIKAMLTLLLILKLVSTINGCKIWWQIVQKSRKNAILILYLQQWVHKPNIRRASWISQSVHP